MSQPYVFVAYARSDREVVEHLQKLLTEENIETWVDIKDLRAGQVFATRIESAIENASCVLVVWSTASIESDWVRAEAEAGLKQSSLIPVLVEDVAPPLGFRSIQYADLRGWTGSRDDPRARNVVLAVKRQLGLTTDYDTKVGVDFPDFTYPTTDVLKRLRRVARNVDAPAFVDSLSRQPLATVLATQLRRLRAETERSSVAVHVDGSWGAGKSTLLNLLEQEFLPASHEHGWIVVRFDAWRQARVGPPWWVLLEALRRQVLSSKALPARLAFRIGEFVSNVGFAAIAASMVLVGVCAGLIVLTLPQGLTLATISESFKLLAALLTALGTIGGGVFLIGRVLAPNSQAGVRFFVRTQRDPMENVAARFRWTVRASGKPILFMIDDLDRCDRDFVVAMLDSMQTLTRSPDPSEHIDEARPLSRQDLRRLKKATKSVRRRGSFDLFFIVAADGRWIRQSYELHHKDLSANLANHGSSLGYLFLAKLFEISVNLPDLGNDARSAYLSELLGAMEGNHQDLEKAAEELHRLLVKAGQQLSSARSEAEILQVLSAAHPRIRHLLADQALDRLNAPDVSAGIDRELLSHANIVEGNPRTLKRFVLNYKTLRAIRTVQGVSVEGQTLAKWVALRLRWPVAAERLRLQPDLAADITHEKLDDRSGLADFLAEPDFRQLFSKEQPGGLTPGLIRACTGILE